MTYHQHMNRTDHLLGSKGPLRPSITRVTGSVRPNKDLGHEYKLS